MSDPVNKDQGKCKMHNVPGVCKYSTPKATGYSYAVSKSGCFHSNTQFCHDFLKIERDSNHA